MDKALDLPAVVHYSVDPRMAAVGHRLKRYSLRPKDIRTIYQLLRYLKSYAVARAVRQHRPVSSRHWLPHCPGSNDYVFAE